MCIHISPKKAGGEWKEDKEMQGENLPTAVLYSFLELLVPETQTAGLAPSTHLSPGTTSRCSSKGNPEF